MLFRSVVYWMGQSQFFSLSGSGVAPIFCPVWDVIFQDLDLTNLDKIRVAPNSRFGEVTWYYPVISNGGEVTNYVKYNVNLQVWDYGTLGRTAWINESVLGPPIGADPSSLYIYQHETSPDADGQAMHVRDAVTADPALQFGVQDRAVHLQAAQGIGPVEDHDLGPVPEAALDRVLHADREGVRANADVLQIDRKSTRLNSSHIPLSRMPSSA